MAGCASTPEPGTDRWQRGPDVVTIAPDQPMSCVPFAREHSGINIHGDAYTWWDQAAGRFARSARPSRGAVMVLAGYAGSHRGHVAVVRKIDSAREIRVDHANWLNNGRIYLDDPVLDISPENDWSQVVVWNAQTGAWGGNAYPVQGFIEPYPERGSARVAQADLDEDR